MLHLLVFNHFESKFINFLIFLLYHSILAFNLSFYPMELIGLSFESVNLEDFRTKLVLNRAQFLFKFLNF